MRRRTMEGTQFPNLKAENLAGRDINLPQDGGKQATILFVAFRRKTQEQIDDWSDALIGAKLQGREEAVYTIGPTGTENGELQIYEVPMLKGRWRLISGIIDGGMRSGIPELQHPYVATFYGDISMYQKALDMDDEEACYLYILDKDGLIWFASAGPPTTELSSDAMEVLRQLLSQS